MRVCRVVNRYSSSYKSNTFYCLLVSLALELLDIRTLPAMPTLIAQKCHGQFLENCHRWTTATGAKPRILKTAAGRLGL